MVPDGHRVQPFVAHGCPELPSTAVLLLQPSIPTEAVVGAAHTTHGTLSSSLPPVMMLVESMTNIQLARLAGTLQKSSPADALKEDSGSILDAVHNAASMPYVHRQW